ncbi:MAG: 2-oxoisovalerate dehydrogenase [Cytophagales bacterium]|nr:MAG: 2-oxoisovalerate dehydrogenase [Cytophagales bacterium]
MNELTFQVEPDEDGGYVAQAKLIGGSIITQGDTLNELKEMIRDAVSGYFFDKPEQLPRIIRLQINEVFALA